MVRASVDSAVHLLSSTLSGRGMGSHFVLASGTNVVLMLLGVVTGALVARTLGAEGRGQLATIQIWGFFLAGGLGQLGIPNALVYFTGRAPEEAGRLLSTAWVVMLTASAFWVAGGWVVLPILLADHDPYTITYARLFLFAVPLACLHAGNMVIQGQKRFRLWSLFKLQISGIYILGLGALILAGTADPGNITLLQLGANGAAAVSIFWFLRRAALKLGRPSLGSARQLLSYGLRSVLGSVPEQLNARLDQIVIALLLPYQALGIYVVSVSWSLILGPFVRAVGDVVFPHVASTSDRESQILLFARTVRTGAMLSLILNLLLLAVTPIAIPLIFGDSFREAVPVAMILLVAVNCYYLKLIMANGLNGLGYPEASAIAEIVGLTATVVLLLLLLPRFGIIGAGVTSVVAYLAASLILLQFAHRRLALPVRLILIPTRADIERLRARLPS